VRYQLTWRYWVAGCLAFNVAWVEASERHHALIVGVGQYSTASGADPLNGVPKDMINARKMALAMSVPEQQIVELRDAKATKANILAALDTLNRKVSPGAKVFIYFSGHGTSFSTSKGCEQGFIPYTRDRYTLNDLISEAELAEYTSKISQKADKAVVMVDACFSGGVVASRTRSLIKIADIRPKFSPPAGDKCDVAVNRTVTRSFAPAMQRLGVPQENFVQISAANYNEVSWDNEQLGGLATHSIGQCLLGDAKDLNASGSITLEEVRQCAQVKLNALMAPHKAAGMLPSTIQMRGTRNLIVVQDPPKPVKVAAVNLPVVPPASLPSVSPVVPTPAPNPVDAPVKPPAAVAPPVSAPAPVAVMPMTPQPTQVVTPVVQATAVPVPPPMVSEAPAETPTESPVQQLAASAATLEDIYAQRNGRLKVEVTAPKSLVIGKDPFAFNVRSSTNGYLYAVMLGSDGKSFYLLYPNKLDQDNQIKANVTYKFPKPGWSIKAAGPEGTNRILFVVSQSPRDPKIFASEDSGGGPFAFSLAEMTARKRLVDFFIGRGVQGKNGQMAAALVSVAEVR
jgi:Domain of unknown function (DUF4384)/Caspase domain